MMALEAENKKLHDINTKLIEENKTLKLKTSMSIEMLEMQEDEILQKEAVIEHYENKFEYKGEK